MLYRKKPVVISAIKWDGWNAQELAEWGQGNVRIDLNNKTVEIDTLSGPVTACVGDYILKGVNGEYYPCKSGIFSQTYEPA